MVSFLHSMIVRLVLAVCAFRKLCSNQNSTQWAMPTTECGRTHTCWQCIAKSIGHTADIMQEFNLVQGPARWVINPVKVLLPSTPLYQCWMGFWIGCSDLEGFSFRTQDFLPNTGARAAAVADSESRRSVGQKPELSGWQWCRTERCWAYYNAPDRKCHARFLWRGH